MLPDRINIRALATDPTWHRLIQFDEEAGLSRIVTPDFFLAPDGRRSPEAELRATIDAYIAPHSGDPDSHPRCRFPARYFWLAQRTGAAAGIEPAADCPRLERWARFDELRSISLVMVSGYFGNPASSFGHTILKLNNGDEAMGLTLLDLGVNYGALVPENEWAPLYVMRGLLGGYEAGYSDKLYYIQDMTYSRIEFRDMWEYELALSDEQNRLVVYHLWEVIGRKFQYFFLKENCAFRMAQLMELATGEDFTSDVDVWYAPVSLFHRLHDIDDRRDQPLIEAIRFVPSSQRVLYAEFSGLVPAEQRRINELIRDPGRDYEDSIADLPPDRQRALLDVLLAYYQYRLVGVDPDDERAQAPVRAEKDEVLRARLAFPAEENVNRIAVPPVRSPAQGSKPSRFGLGMGYNDEFGGRLGMTLTAFHYDIIGNNNLEGSELVVADIVAGYSRDEGLFLDRLDFVRARKTNINTARIQGENRWSWTLGTGLKRHDLSCSDCLELYGSGGLGRAWPVTTGLLGYAMLEVSLETDGDHVVFRPMAGLRIDRQGRWASRLEAAYEQGVQGDTDTAVFLWETRYSLSRNNEVRVELAHEEATEAVIWLHHFW